MTKKKKYLSDIARRITFHHRSRITTFLDLDANVRAQTMSHLSSQVQRDIVRKIDDSALSSLLEQFDPVDATNIIRFLPERRGKKIIETLSDDLRRNIELLVQFDPQTAAGIMNIDYIQVDENDLVKDVARKFKTHEENTGRLPVIIVLRDGRVIGHMPGHQFGFAKPSEKVHGYVKKIPKVNSGDDRREVLNIFRRNRHNKVVVVGAEQNVLGIIYSDDIIRLLKEETSASLYEFAGVANEEEVGDPASRKVKFRYKWLMVNLATAFLASFTVGLFDETISKYVLLAVYMPIVAGMGGNAATQTLAVLVRGIALKQITLRTAWPTLMRELGAGLVNGVINGVLVAAVVVLFNGDYMIGFILAMAMIVNLFVAAFFGTMVPLVMKRLGKDPATSATIFITTATDVLGFLAFLGLASILLS